MDGLVEIITVVSTVSARNVYVDAQVPLFFLEVGERFPQVLDACSGEGRDGIVVVDIEDCEAAARSVPRAISYSRSSFSLSILATRRMVKTRLGAAMIRRPEQRVGIGPSSTATTRAGATPDDRQCEPVRRRARRADRCR